MELLIKGVLSGDTRHWGVVQYRQWNTYMGKFPHIGIELETKEYIPWEIQKKMPRVYKNCPLLGEVRLTHEKEIQFLFSTEIKEFLQQSEILTKSLKNYKIHGLGSVHVNFEMSIVDINKLKNDQVKGLYERLDPVNRLECKYGYSFITVSHLRLGILLLTLCLLGKKDIAIRMAEYADNILKETHFSFLEYVKQVIY